MKTWFFNTLTASTLAMAALTTAASAGCFGENCNGDQTSNFQPFDLQIEAMVNGFGGAETIIDGSKGVDGEVFAGRDSFSNQEITAWLGSDLCPDDCKEGGFDVTQTVGEHVFSGGLATNTGGAGTAASIAGVTMSSAMTDLMVRFTRNAED